MKNSDGAIAASDPTSLLDDAKTCAYLLNDALECADVAEVAAAVRIVQRSHGSTVHGIGPMTSMTVAEMLDVLENAGVQLVAIPKHRRGA